MKKIFIFVFIIIAVFSYAKDGFSDPRSPVLPIISDETGDSKILTINFQNQLGKFGKGTIIKNPDIIISVLLNDNDSKEIKLEDVRSVRFKGYTTTKNTKGNLSAVYYLPYYFNLTLKDGTEIKDVKGRIPELDSFTVNTKFGPKKYYSYFGRYWLEDKKIFNDNKSGNYYEKAKVPDEVIIYIEFK